MERCHLVVFNCDRIRLFLNAFWRVRGFDVARDRLIVLDCSTRPDVERRALEDFCRERDWRLGREVHFVRRSNWGQAEGARVDYFRSLARAPRQQKFIWQFQDHFLDLESPLSRSMPGERDIDGRPLDGQVKGDVIADGAVIDIDACEALLDAHPTIGVLHAGRGGLGFFTALDRSCWFFADGGNSCMRPDLVRRLFPPGRLSGYRAVYNSRAWPLYMEFEWGRALSETGCDWYHVGDGVRVNPRAIDAALAQPGALLPAAPEYAPIHAAYARRFERVMRLPAMPRAWLGWSRQRYWPVRNRLRALIGDPDRERQA